MMQESHLETNIYISHLLPRKICTVFEVHVSPKEIKIICEKVSEEKTCQVFVHCLRVSRGLCPTMYV